MKKVLFCLLVLWASIVTVMAQVSWDATAERIRGNVYKLTVKGTVSPGYRIYGQDAPQGARDMWKTVVTKTTITVIDTTGNVKPVVGSFKERGFKMERYKAPGKQPKEKIVKLRNKRGKVIGKDTITVEKIVWDYLQDLRCEARQKEKVAVFSKKIYLKKRKNTAAAIQIRYQVNDQNPVISEVPVEFLISSQKPLAKN